MVDTNIQFSTKREISPKRRRAKSFYVVITGILSLSVVLICGELMVRMFLPFDTPDTLKRRSLQYTGSLFSRSLLKPTQFVVKDDHSKGKAPGEYDGYRINAAGYRGPDFVLRKPEGITRIVVIGGSSVFDVKARDSIPYKGNDWPRLVERFLKAKGFENVEVVNAGIPAHASFDALGRLYSQLWMYEPDYVLFYGIWNDIKYFRQLTLEKPLISLYAGVDSENPFIEYQGFWDRWLSHSQLYMKFRSQYYGWKFQRGEEGAIPKAAYQETYSPYAVKQYRLNVQLIVDTCREIGAIPILLTEATLVSSSNSEEERQLIGYKYQALTHSALVRAFDDAYEVIRSVGEQKRVAVLDLAKEFNGDVELFADAVHFTARGSEKIADRVASFLASHIELRSGSENEIFDEKP